MKNKLYGDGIHLDTEAIQELLDTKNPLIELPVPKAFYLIDKPLKIHSFQELRLSRYTTIKLADMSNCHMLENADYKEGNRDIKITGGIWDYNNMGQLKNPYHYRTEEYPKAYDGRIFQIKNVTNLLISDITFKDPVTYACCMDRVSYFTVEDVIFDFNLGNPRPMNMDGIHIDGNSHFGLLRNLKGTCYDDLVALNADEGSDGPITHIEVDGIFSEGCHSAVRMLTVKNELSNIHIHNVHGTFFQYGIGLTKYYEGEASGYYDSIILENLFISKSPRYSYLHMSEEVALHSYVYPIVYIEDELNIKSLTIKELHRKEKSVAVETIYLGNKAKIKNLTVKNCSTINKTSEEFEFFVNKGKIEHLVEENNRFDGKQVLIKNS